MKRLLLASFCSETGEWMLQIALPVLVFQATGSVASTALMMIIGLLPMVLLSPLTGLVADRVHRPRLLLVVCVGQAAVAAPLLADDAMCWVVMALQTSLAAFFEPARNALVADLVPVERRTAANGLLAAAANVARLVGAWLGGLLLAVGGIPLVYVVYAAVLVVGAAAMCGPFPVTRPAKAGKPPPLRLDRSMVPVGVALTLMCVAQGIFLVRFVPFVLETLGAGSDGVGLLRGVQAIGGLAAGFAVATIARRIAPMNLFAWGAVTFGLVSAAIWHGPALTTAIGVYVGMFVAVGAPGVVANSGLAAVLQSAVPAAATGRLLAAAFALMTIGATAGMLAAGVVTSPLLLDAQAFLHVAAGVLLLADQHRHRVRDGRRAGFAGGEAAQLQAGEQRDDRAGQPVR